jgi:hypothetical protein
MGSGLAAPAAHAQSERFRDAGGDAPAAIDVLSVGVKNFARVVVTARYENLRNGRSGGWTVFVDTNKGRVGPEFGVTGGLSQGTDFSVYRTRHWKYASGPKSCPLDMDVNYKRDTSTFVISRRCLDRPERVRVAVSAGKARPDGSWRRDWAPRRHRFYDWVPRG